MTRFSTLLDKVVDRGQYIVRCDRQALILEEIDEHIQDGHKIWDFEFGLLVGVGVGVGSFPPNPRGGRLNGNVPRCRGLPLRLSDDIRQWRP